MGQHVGDTDRHDFNLKFWNGLQYELLTVQRFVASLQP
jgi:hypothetical protein